MIHLNNDQQGGLEIGGIDLTFNLKIGNVLILDTDQLCYGTEESYDDSLEDVLSVSATDRLVDLFIIYPSYLQLFDLPPPLKKKK